MCLSVTLICDRITCLWFCNKKGCYLCQTLSITRGKSVLRNFLFSVCKNNRLVYYGLEWFLGTDKQIKFFFLMDIRVINTLKCRTKCPEIPVLDCHPSLRRLFSAANKHVLIWCHIYFEALSASFSIPCQNCVLQSHWKENWAANGQINSFRRKKIYSAAHPGITPFRSYFTTSCITRNKPQDGLHSRAFSEGKRSQGRDLPEKCVCTRQNTFVMFRGAFLLAHSLL